MYRLSPFGTADDALHFLVATLVHRAGWLLVDAYIDSLGYLTSWPDVVDTPAITDGDFAVLKPPSSGLTGNGDHVRIEYLSATPSIDLSFFRRSNGTLPAWNPATHALYDALSTLTLVQSMDLSNVGGSQLVFVAPEFFTFMHMDTGSNALFSGAWMGYLRTAALGIGEATPVLGVGVDPFPLTSLDLTSLEGEVVGVSNVLNPLRGVTTFLDTVTNDMLAGPVNYGVDLPSEVLVSLLGMEEAGAITPYFRGLLPGLFRTSRVESLTPLQLRETGAVYLTVADGLAVGPLE